MNYALLSVSNKDGIVDFARGLVSAGYTLISSGGTHAVIQAEDGIRDLVRSRGLGDVYKRQDIVAVNLYPFEETVAKPDVTFEEAIENIDIGGPSMVRSAAKNHKHVAVLTNPNQYGIYLDALKGNIASVTVEMLRPNLAIEAFKHTAEYDAAITEWMRNHV